MGNVLITGSNGFIAKYVLKCLSDSFYCIGCGIEESPNNPCDEYVKWDLSRDDEPEKLKNLSIDYIIHMAASLDMKNLSGELVNANCYGTFNVLTAAVNHKVKRVVYFSSLPVIGNSHETPILDSAPFDPPTLYHATKAAGELIIQQARGYGIDTVQIRVPSPIGPNMRRNTIVPVFIQKALQGEDLVIQGKGSRKQNYLDVRDLAEAVKRIVAHDDICGTFNIGARNIISNLELAQLCVEVLGSKSKIMYAGNADNNDNIDWATDDSRLRAKIGEYQKHSMKDSIVDIAGKMI